MHALKSAIFTLIVVLTLLFGYAIFKFDHHHVLKICAQAYDQQDYEKALKILHQVPKKHPKEIDLYEGYVLSALESPKEATIAFLKAYEAQDELIKQESLFNLLTLAYQDKNYVEMKKYLRQCSKDESYTFLFHALYHFKQKNYQEALSFFEKIKNPSFHSPWMEKVWTQNFSKRFQVEHKAHCLTLLGKVDQARSLILHHIKETKEKSSYLSFLLGLTYLKESESVSYKSALSLLKKASDCFKELSQKEFTKRGGYDLVKRRVQNLWPQLLEQGSEQELQQWLSLQMDLGLFSTEFQKELLDHQFLKSCFKQPEQFLKLLEKLQTLPFDAASKNYFSNLFFEPLMHWIGSEEGPLFIEDAHSFSPFLCFSEEQMEAMSEKIVEKGIELLHSDVSFTAFYQLMLFWDACEKREESRLAFIEEFYPTLRELWPQNAQRAFQAAKVLDQICHYPQREDHQASMLEIIREASAEVKPKKLEQAYQYFNPIVER